jgi:hypothetical protein
MSWEIYDKTKFIDYLGSSYNIKLLSQLGYPAINTFLNNANTTKGVDAKILKDAIAELEQEPEWMWLADILKKATPPVRIADGTESWLRRLYPNEEWLEPE